MVVINNQISTFRRYFPQALSCFAKNSTLLNLTLAVNLPTIIIPSLTGLNAVNNPNEHLSITSDEASWIASIYSLFFVIGALMSNYLDPLGRKKSLMLGNIPYLICWLSLYYYANSVQSICIILAVMGCISGCMEAPLMLFLSEVAEVRIRTILLIVHNITFEIGAALVYYMGNQMPWRDATLFYAMVPIMAILSLSIIPDSPHWLLSHNRPVDALKSLQWFRGWVEPNVVRIEFENLQRYKALAYVCYECEKRGEECNHPQPNILGRFRDCLRRKTIIPFCIVICLLSNSIFGGAIFRPFLVSTLTSFKSPIDPNTVLVWVGYAGLASNFLSMIVIRLFGRRRTHLISLAVALAILYAFSVYGFLQFNQYDIGLILKYFPVIGFVLLIFLQNFGLRCIPVLLLSEVFSYRSKSLASGITTAVFNMGLYVTAKTYHLLQAAITLPGQCVFYATIGVLGFVVTYLILPETEGRTLEDIEMYFSDKKRKFNDIHIPEITDQKRITNQSKCMRSSSHIAV